MMWSLMGTLTWTTLRAGKNDWIYMTLRFALFGQLILDGFAPHLDIDTKYLQGFKRQWILTIWNQILLTSYCR